MVYPSILARHGRLIAAALAATSLLAPAHARAEVSASATIERIKPSIVAVGTFERLRNPQFSFSGTGFVVGDGRLVATNAHVVSKVLDVERGEALVVAVRGPQNNAVVRPVRRVVSDTGFDLALLRFEGAPLPALQLGDGEGVREGETYLFTGFPIGSVLGLVPVTHRAMIASITPLVIPAARAAQLDARAVRRLAAGSFSVFQLDGTAYPGNSGSPVYHPETGAVIGVVNSVFVKGTKESALTAPSGITYAIPAQKLKDLLSTAR